VAHLGGLRTLHVRQVPRSGGGRALKGVLERSVAALALLALSPLMLTIAAGIRLTSPGPAIYRQKRVGHHGREFTMLKFRTMRKDADRARDVLDGRNECDAVLFKMRQDPRVTPFGKRLREYSLDEVPQLINVVLGHMSLVGPRPALPAEVAEYDHDPRRRLTVKPGLTGLWQVSGRSDLAWDEAVRLDLLYVDNWSLGLDLAIVARTFGAVLGHRGAY
jgi:lipopolysaccharide/colanic/teichoic acid biosynthesis glycosyltransferase